MANITNADMIFLDSYKKVGAAYQIQIHGLYNYDDGEKRWVYFGSDPENKPPTTGHQVVQKNELVFPRDFILLDDEEKMIYDIAVMASFNIGEV